MTKVEEQLDNKNTELVRMGLNFLGILNDIKRRPEDASHELGLPLDYINDIIKGKKEISEELISKAIKIWPVNARDFFLMKDDAPNGVKIMSAEDSKKTSRIMNRAGKPYYEYRDTAMSSVAPFRPEWILELCRAENNDPENKLLQWNNGHFMHQFTYFIGEVNFYYLDEHGNKQVSVMNTGDTMYITPFVPHTFATRKGASENGLILALTYGNKLTGDPQQELSALNIELGAEFVLDFSSKEKSSGSLVKFHRELCSMSIEEVSRLTHISIDNLRKFENGEELISIDDYKKLANAFDVNIRDLMPNDKIEKKVIVEKYENARKWPFPESTKAYEFVELLSSKNLPFSKAYEINILHSNDNSLDLKVGLHQYGYNVCQENIEISWKIFGHIYKEILHPGDSFYMKPFVQHNFRGSGKLLVLRIGGKVAGESQRELSLVGKDNVHRAIAETIQWFDNEGKN